MRHNDPFGVEAAEPTAPMPTGMLFLTSLGRHHRLSGIIPYLFLRRAQPTTTLQRPSTRRDLNDQHRSPWCPTPGAAAQNSHPVCWMIVVCVGAGSEAPWRPWDDGGHHGGWVHVLASFYLAKTHVTTRNNQSIRPDQRFADCYTAKKYVVTSGRR